MNTGSGFQQVRGSDEKFLHIPYNQRWEHLKPHIVSMFMDDGLSIDDIATRMKDEFDFIAVPDQYKYQLFRKWRIKKRTTKSEKETIIRQVAKRPRSIASSSRVAIDSGGYIRSVDKKQLKRYIGDSVRRPDDFQINTAFFTKWNLPYKAFMSQLGLPFDHPSPLEKGPPTPANITAITSQSTSSPSTRIGGPSPTTHLILRKLQIDQSKLLLQGRELELLKQLGERERTATVTWMHEYWMYAFMTAKYWGTGPRLWTPGLINFKSMGAQTLLGPTSPENQTFSHVPAVVQAPNTRCHWTIHHDETNMYEELPLEVADTDEEEDYDVDDEATWPTWTDTASPRDYAGTIREGLASNSFSSLNQDDLPISTDLISKSCAKGDERQRIEALRFAIMARNLDVVEDIYKNMPPKVIKENDLLHLAAAYLDGSRQCCLLMSEIYFPFTFKTDTKDELNHSILDALFVTVLRSHTRLSPASVSASLRTKFPGEEVDICGRWDADSPQVRQLFASGAERIPQEWKHNFCHTSTQAVCHSIQTIFSADFPVDINETSGLFTRCASCPRGVTPGPLHTLVRVAFHLAQDGFQGETLFGALACLVCLIIHGAHPLLQAQTFTLNNVSTAGTCSHRDMTAFELAKSLTLSGVPDAERVLGWNVFVSVLEYITQGAAEQYGLEEDEEDACIIDVNDHRLHKFFNWDGHIELILLWSAIQTEFLSYRKIEDEDPSISPRFNMATLFDGLRDGLGPVNIQLIEMEMMNIDQDGHLKVRSDGYKCLPTVTQACSSYYANVERWGRIKFIGVSKFE